jgi:Na+-driven multidrug efflux pump
MGIIFIIVFKTGVAGAATATVIAETCSAIFCGIYIWKNYRELLPKKRHFYFNKEMYIEMLSAGFSMAMMQCVFSIGSVVQQRAINGLGDTIITAHTAARRIIEILMQPLSTIASATSTFVSQNWGAGKVERIKTTLRQALKIEIGWGIFSALLVYCFGSRFIAFITGTTDNLVIDNAVMNLRINLMFYPELGILLCMRMAMQAMGQKIMPVISSSIELVIKVVAAFFLIPTYGYVFASFTEPVTWLVCMLFLVAVYYLFMHNKIYTE